MVSECFSRLLIVFHFCVLYCVYFFFFKQKTAYEMRISDWSSDVCSSDLRGGGTDPAAARKPAPGAARRRRQRRVKRQPLKAFCKIGRASCRERVCQYV